MSRKRALPASQQAFMPARPNMPALPAPLQEQIQDTLLTSFRELGLPLLERLSRTDPKEYRMWFAMALAAAQGTKVGQEMQGTVVNVVNAIPRSPLDNAPDNFGR
jgi:hypothetical protein